ncbi:MAG: hypothetical protein IPG48_08180 [Saprospiraceae bacterium]|nr:hypothetical protein [Saprospiraceae bacterium]MBK6666119.1 hypothetical protein [Saprospiraceae bacterium]MBK7700509.1 hypothetical protein [Saprospiraceae bacterium]MBK8827985.1 hypothetical protein [Saprospiraceae bacterium]
MKKVNFIIILLAVIIITWIGSSIRNVQNAKSRVGIILSPDKTKSVEFINAINTSQILMNYHKAFTVGGSNVVSGDFKEEDINLKWRDQNTLIIEYPKGIELNNKEDELYFFGEIVQINYKEQSEEINTATTK